MVVAIVVVAAGLFLVIVDDGERADTAFDWIRTAQLAMFGLTLVILAFNGVVRLRKRFGRNA